MVLIVMISSFSVLGFSRFYFCMYVVFQYFKKCLGLFVLFCFPVLLVFSKIALTRITWVCTPAAMTD